MAGLLATVNSYFYPSAIFLITVFEGGDGLGHGGSVVLVLSREVIYSELVVLSPGQACLPIMVLSRVLARSSRMVLSIGLARSVSLVLSAQMARLPCLALSDETARLGMCGSLGADGSLFFIGSLGLVGCPSGCNDSKSSIRTKKRQKSHNTFADTPRTTGHLLRCPVRLSVCRGAGQVRRTNGQIVRFVRFVRLSCAAQHLFSIDSGLVIFVLEVQALTVGCTELDHQTLLIGPVQGPPEGASDRIVAVANLVLLELLPHSFEQDRPDKRAVVSRLVQDRRAELSA